jgi:hypothetical protein
MSISRKPFAFAIGAALALPVAAQNTLTGFASLHANTFAEGPTSGQFAGAGNFGNALPLIDKQPVQGFSAVLNGPVAGSFYVMQDNGFGAKDNSADTILRLFAVQPDFKRFSGGAVIGSGTVAPINFNTGTALGSFSAASFVQLRDPDAKLGFPIVAGMANYPNGLNNIPVHATIASGKLLTGSDFDIEAVRKDRNGNLWFGDEFGPYLIKTDATGKVLRNEIALPRPTSVGGIPVNLGANPIVQSPQNPLPQGANNHPRSGGFEGMAINISGTKLYPMLELPLTTDPDQKRLLINEFDLATESFTGTTFGYKLDPQGTNIGDLTAVTDSKFLVIERDGRQGDPTIPAFTNPAQFKKIFMIDISQVDAQGFVKKTEVVDLMNIADPHDLNGDGKTTFNFPFVTIENVLVIDQNTLLVINDNNYPGSSGRAFGVSDNNEFILVSLSQPVPEPETYALMAAGLGLVGWAACRRKRSAKAPDKIPADPLLGGFVQRPRTTR